MARTKKTYENAEYAAMVGRMVKAYGRRLADSDPTDLPDALAMVAELDAAIGAAVRQMRATGGFSWAEIAAYTGTSRQAAQQRWGKATHADRLAVAQAATPNFASLSAADRAAAVDRCNA